MGSDLRLPRPRRCRHSYGTDIYTDNSSVCAAAVHAGLITFNRGGTIEIRLGQNSYQGSHRNRANSVFGGSCPSSLPLCTDDGARRRTCAHDGREGKNHSRRVRLEMGERDSDAKIGRPRRFAALAAFLVSERASYIMGTSLPVDGGCIRSLL